MILAPNHFSFMDHFLMGAYIRRKVRFMAKSQLFKKPMQFIYTHGGVFPVRRGAKDDDVFITAKAILARGGAITMYCEGGRSRTGKVAEQAKRGIGRLALETGAPVVPIAIYGSSKVRNWKRLQFPKVTVQYGDADLLGARREPDPRAAAGGRRRGPEGDPRASTAVSKNTAARGSCAVSASSAAPSAAPPRARPSPEPPPGGASWGVA